MPVSKTKASRVGKVKSSSTKKTSELSLIESPIKTLIKFSNYVNSPFFGTGKPVLGQLKPVLYSNIGKGPQDPELKAWFSLLQTADKLNYEDIFDPVSKAYKASSLDHCLDILQKAICFVPDFNMYAQMLGALLCYRQAADEGLKNIRRAIKLDQGNHFYHYNYGLSLQNARKPLEALIAYQTAIILDPSHFLSNLNFGTVFQSLDKQTEAAKCYDRSIIIDPEHSGVRHNRALVTLTLGDYVRGWLEYEWRWRTPLLVNTCRNLGVPLWKKEPGYGRTVFIFAEQGCGDSLQFYRYVPLMTQLGWKVILEIQPALLTLFQHQKDLTKTILLNDPVPPIDAAISMMSLPLMFGTTLETIPRFHAYISPREDKKAAWKHRLNLFYGNAPRVGFVWSGDPRPDLPDCNATDFRRSTSPDLLRPLLKHKHIRFFSLQKTGSKAPRDFNFIDFMDEMNDFDDTAALTANLDLVITVDTAMSHLSASIGVPVWLMDRHDSCWRWLRGRDDTPWYDNFRIFRQPKMGDWPAVISQIDDALAKRFPT